MDQCQTPPSRSPFKAIAIYVAFVQQCSLFIASLQVKALFTLLTPLSVPLTVSVLSSGLQLAKPS